MNELITVDNNSKNDNFKCRLNTPSGVIHCDKDHGSPITLHGYLPHFAQYLHESSQLEDFVNSCPLFYKSNNAPAVKDVLGTTVLSILSGHKRYCHAASLYGDNIAAELLGMDKIVSPDSLMRGIDKMNPEAVDQWLRDSYRKIYEPLLTTPYILDLDPTVKVLYGHQEGAEIGYNPQKPGRRSHCYHTYFIGALRLVLDVEVHPGNETAGLYSHKRLWNLLDEMPVQCLPALIRGDIGFGNEGTMAGCEKRGLHFLFKLKQSGKIKKLLSELETPGHEWNDAGDGWLGYETEIKLSGWSCKRRIVVLRRPHSTKQDEISLPQNELQPELPLAVVVDDCPQYEYQILITNTTYDISALAQLYRDRGDCENNFDELKNDWGWGGFNSRKLRRTQVMASLVGIVYNWWNIFCRLAEPEKHMEARTSRPLFQNIVGRLTKTGGSRYIYISAMGAAAEDVMKKFTRISRFISSLCSTATQLTKEQKWTAILREAFKKFWPPDQIKTVSSGHQILLNL
jgi:hypothetical protein